MARPSACDASAGGGAADAAPRRRRGGGLVPERSHGGPEDFFRRPRGARAPFPGPLADGVAGDGPAGRDAGRLLPARGRGRLAGAVPAVLRAARRRQLPRRVEAAARVLEQLLVARSRRVAGAHRARARAARDALPPAAPREPPHPPPRAPP